MKRAKLTEEQKAARRHARSSEKKNARLADEHPLFVEQLKAEGAFTTPAAEYWHWRRNKAAAAENIATVAGQAIDGLKAIEYQALERYAKPILGEHHADVCAAIRRIYPPGLWFAVLADVLTKGTSIGVRHDRRSDPAKVNHLNPEGFYLVTDYAPPVGWPGKITRETFDRDWPIFKAPLEQHDGGLRHRLEVAVQA